MDYKLYEKIENELGHAWYILDIKGYTDNYNRLLDSFREIYPKTELAYSYKTNYIPELCKIVDQHGGFAEVVSEMEYDLAKRIGVDSSRIIVNGPYKPEDALRKYLLNGSVVNLDSYHEVEILLSLCESNPLATFNIGLRCNFEFSGLSVSRFGFDVENPQFYAIYNKLSGIANIKIINLHCHFPNRELMLFGERVDKMISLYRKLYRDGYPLWIDIGGGLGGKLDESVKKQLSYEVADYSDYAKLIATKISREFEMDDYKPLLIIEPGTALVADTMKFVCKVLEIKEIRGKYIALVSGSKVNFHPMASKINVPMQVVSKNDSGRRYYESIDISGYTCMEGDYLYRGYTGELAIGDYVVFDNVGSYSIVFKPPFIMPNVPIITIENGEITILKKAETFDHIFQTYNF